MHEYSLLVGLDQMSSTIVPVKARKSYDRHITGMAAALADVMLRYRLLTYSLLGYSIMCSCFAFSFHNGFSGIVGGN